MIAAGFSPSVRLFEAGACGTPIITDEWAGLESFFKPGREILIARSAAEVASYITSMPEKELARVAEAARKRVLAEHTAAHRVESLEAYLAEGAISRNAHPSKTKGEAATKDAEA
jgi:spore maturation protein CgeB